LILSPAKTGKRRHKGKSGNLNHHESTAAFPRFGAPAITRTTAC
jgi:hypothetical protein